MYKQDIVDRKNKGKYINTFRNDYVVVDIETTGLNPTNNEIIEIGALRVRNNEVVETMDVLIKPEEEIPAFITNLTGITNDMVEKEGVSAFEGLATFLDFVQGEVILGHNVNFDISFLYDHCLRHLGCYVDNDYMDTCYMARRLLRGKVKNNKLQTLIEYFGYDYSGAHRAVNDCMFTHQVYNELKRIVNEK